MCMYWNEYSMDFVQNWNETSLCKTTKNFSTNENQEAFGDTDIYDVL